MENYIFKKIDIYQLKISIRSMMNVEKYRKLSENRILVEKFLVNSLQNFTKK